MMLRAFIQLFAVIVLLGAVVLVLVEPHAWPFLVMAGLFALGTLFERFYYRGGPWSGRSPAPGGPWEPTAERFRDEETGALVTVWFNPATGERRYVDQGAPPPA